MVTSVELGTEVLFQVRTVMIYWVLLNQKKMLQTVLPFGG